MGGKIGRFKVALAPIQFGGSFREVRGHTQALRQVEKYLEVRFRLAEWLNALMLKHGYAVVALRERVVDVTTTIGEFADVPAFEVGAGREDDVREFRFALKPDRLVDDKLQFVSAVHVHVPVRVGHCAEVRPAVLVVELYR